MKLILFLLLLGISSFFLSPHITHAQAPQPQKQEFYKAKVNTIVSEGKKDVGSKQNISQIISVHLLEGPDKGKDITMEHGGMFTISESQKVTSGDTVVLTRSSDQTGKAIYSVADKYRLPWVGGILAGFFLIVFFIAGKKGLGALLGMIFSLAVIMWFIVPQILGGADPLLISVTGSVFILIVTMYLAHGFKTQTHIALSATALSLFLTALFSILFVSIARLSGLGSEDAYTLQQGFNEIINFRGLLLGGIIIGALGVLDDVTTTQAATVHELHETNPKATFEDLFRKGMRVGQEHIASVVNTLVLAYAGASIGIFIFLHLGMQQEAQPLWVMLNSEVIMEEVIRTLAGSLGLILAVPITTLLAAFFAKNTIKIQ
jgi:uncharacterized membrane protein